MNKLNLVTGSLLVAALAGVGVGPRTADASGTPPTASATISPTQVSPTSYQYSMTLTDAAGSANTIGTFWYSWTPGKDFMDTSPTSVSMPAGWTETITGGGATDGYAIMYVASSPSFYIQPGGSLGGFSYTSADTPAIEFGNSAFFPTTPILKSVAYDAGAFSDAGDTFVVTASPVPEPVALAFIAPALTLLSRRKPAADR